MKRKMNQRMLDLLILLVLLIAILLFLGAAVLLKVIPAKFMGLIIVLLLAIFAALALPVLLKKKQYHWLRRGLAVGLSFCLILGGGYIFAVHLGLSGFSEKANVTVLGIAVLKEDKLKNADAILNKNIGVLALSNETVEKALQEYDAYEFNISKFATTSEMLELLQGRALGGVLMYQNDFRMKSEQDPAFKDTYELISPVEIVQKSEETVIKDLSNTPFTVFISGMEIVEAPDVNGLSDVNMLLMVDPIKHHIEMISIPRDAYVPNSAFDHYPDKLTHLGNNGPYDMMETLEGIFDIEIDYYARVSFSSLMQIVDTLGGVDVDVQLEFEEQNENREMYNGQFINTIHLYPGMQTLNGSEALAYARHRKTEGWGDAGRNYAQRQIIEALVNKVLTVEGIAKVPELLKVAQQYVSTNVPMDEVRDFVRVQAETMPSWSFGSIEMANWVSNPAEHVASDDTYLVWVCYLSESDVAAVHSYYKAMTQGVQLKDFAFELDDMSAHLGEVNSVPYFVTAENYDEVMSKYFPEYYR